MKEHLTAGRRPGGRARGIIRAALTLALAAVVITVTPGAALALSTPAAPLKGTYQVTTSWHGSQLYNIPAGHSIDLAPRSGATSTVHAVGNGTVARRCDNGRDAWVLVNHGSLGYVSYVHLRSGVPAVGATVSSGQQLGTLYPSSIPSGGSCGSSSGSHLHLGFSRKESLNLGGTAVSTARGATVTFPSGGAPTRFSSDATSSLSVSSDGQQVRLTVCANNIVGQSVRVRLSRPAVGSVPAKAWSYTARPGSRCTTFADMEGAGAVMRGVTYTSRAALNQSPSTSWPASGCYAATGGQGLCDQVRRP